MNTKLKLLVGLFILIALVVIGFLFIGYALEPLDPFARSKKPSNAPMARQWCSTKERLDGLPSKPNYLSGSLINAAK